MSNVKGATNAAKKFLVFLMGRNAVSDIRLEEIEIEEDDDGNIEFWNITLSYLPRELDPLISPMEQRIYKIFTIEDETENFVSMKIREIA